MIQVIELVEAVLVEDQVGDHQNGAAPFPQLIGQVPEAQVRFPIKALVRLIEQQDIRIVHERESEIEFLLGTTAQAAYRSLR